MTATAVPPLVGLVVALGPGALVGARGPRRAANLAFAMLGLATLQLAYVRGVGVACAGMVLLALGEPLGFPPVLLTSTRVLA
jgi:hypothetical protein